ncbi:MAG TPA: hypothetical protein VNA27_16600 [Rubrobacteraceae bacterium]|nr:hypothetical protein [Rubrobacteraceae bacterium]
MAKLHFELLGVRVSKPTVCHAVKRLGYTRKRSVVASERDKWSRAAWRTLVAGAVDTSRLMFVDEMSANTSLCPLYAYSP